MILFIPACGGSDDATPDEADGAASTVPEADEVEADTTSVVPQVDDTDASQGPTTTEPDEWDLVVFADRNMIGETMVDDYAQRISEQIGLPVNAVNWAITGLESDRILAMVRDEGYPELGDVVADAEVIVVNGKPSGLDSASGAKFDACLGTLPRPRDVENELTMEEMAPTVRTFQGIFERIFELRAGQPTVIIAMDYYNPWLDGWRDLGVDQECTQVWETFSASVQLAASESGVPFVSMYDLLNGSAHDIDAREAGYLDVAMWQTNDTGTAMVVDALMAVGLDPVEPPG